MTGALGFDPRMVLARIQGDASRPDEAGFSRLAGLAALPPSNSHSVASPAAGAEAPAPHDGRPEQEAALDPVETAGLARELAAAAATVAEVLRTAPPAEDAEAMAEYYASEPPERPYVPGDTDRLRDGLWAGARERVLHKEGRIRAAEAQPLFERQGRIPRLQPGPPPPPRRERPEGEDAPAAGGEFRRG
jgi:hypothetical protein